MSSLTGRAFGVVVPTLVAATLGAATASAAPTFSPAAHYPAGNFPADVAAGDFNRDGKPDVVVPNTEIGTLSVLRGVGDGTLLAPATVTASGNPRAVAVADFNADGRQDVAYVHGSSPGRVEIVFGNGDGTFQLPTLPYTVGNGPRDIAARDMDGDGAPDLVTANATSGTVSVLLNQGGGVFGTASEYAAGPGARSVALASGLIATANFGNDTASALVRDNLGGWSGWNQSVGSGPSWVGLADLDRDGNTDLVTANEGSNDVSVQLGDGAGGVGGSRSFTAGQGAVGGVLADLDFDGRPDLVTTDRLANTASLLANNGDATFAAPVAAGVGVAPSAATSVDLDQDGRLDVVVANTTSETVSVLRNRTPLPAGAPSVNLVMSTGRSDLDRRVYPLYGGASIEYSCAPGENGAAIVSCEGPVPSGRTLNFRTIGPAAFTVTATAADGQTGTATVRYTVAAPPIIDIAGVTPDKVYAQGAPLTLTWSCRAGQYGLGIRECFEGSFNRTGKVALATDQLGPQSYDLRAVSEEDGFTRRLVKYTVAEPPSVTVDSPYENQALLKGDDMPLRYSCAGGLNSGKVTSCTATQAGPKLDTATVGEKVLKVTAATESGLSTTKTVHYSVARCQTSIVTASGAIRLEALYPACVVPAGQYYLGGNYRMISGRFTMNGLPFAGRVFVADDGSNMRHGAVRFDPYDGGTKMNLCLAAPARDGSCPEPLDVQVGGVKLSEGGFGFSPPAGRAVELLPQTLGLYQQVRLRGMRLDKIQLTFGMDGTGERYAKVGASVALPWPLSATPAPATITADGLSRSVANPLHVPIGLRYDRTGAHVDDAWPATGSEGMRLTASEGYLGAIPVKDICFAASGSSACPQANAPRSQAACHAGESIPSVPADAWTGGVSLVLPKFAAGTSLRLSGSLTGDGIVRLDGAKTALSIGSHLKLGTLGVVLCTQRDFADKLLGRSPVSLRGSLDAGSIFGFGLPKSVSFAYDDRWSLNGADRPWRAQIGTSSLSFKGVGFKNVVLGVNGSGQIDVAAGVEQDLAPGGVFYANGHVGGWLDPARTKFSFSGSANACLKGVGCVGVGRFLVSSKGAAACANASFAGISWHPGVGVTWNPFDVDIMASSCGTGDYDEVRPTRRRAAGGSAASFPLPVPAGQKLFAVRAYGADAPPKLVLTPPDGSAPFTSPAADGGETGEGRYHYAENPADNSTTVVALVPAAGTWTVASADAVRPLVKVERAAYLPPATATGSVTGTGQRRTLHLIYSKGDSERIELVERGRSYGRTIATSVDGAPCHGGRTTEEGATLLCATVPFRPRLGATGKRTIQAVVSNAAGVDQQMLHVADFRIASFPRPARPRGLRLRRLSGSRVLVRWRAAARASTTIAAIRLADGRRLSRTVAGKRRSLVIAHVTRNVAVRVALRGVRSDQVMGRGATARLAPARERLTRSHYAPRFAAFGSGRAALGRRERAWLRHVLPRIRHSTAIACEGHSSPWDGVDRTWLDALAVNRATRVCRYLKRIGYRGLVTAAGFGATRPRTGNATLHGQRLNARVTLVVTRAARR